MGAVEQMRREEEMWMRMKGLEMEPAPQPVLQVVSSMMVAKSEVVATPVTPENMDEQDYPHEYIGFGD